MHGFQPIGEPLCLALVIGDIRLTLPRIVAVTPKNIPSNPYNDDSGSLVITIIVKGVRPPAVTSCSITQFPVTSD